MRRGEYTNTELQSITKPCRNKAWNYKNFKSSCSQGPVTLYDHNDIKFITRSVNTKQLVGYMISVKQADVFSSVKLTLVPYCSFDSTEGCIGSCNIGGGGICIKVYPRGVALLILQRDNRCIGSCNIGGRGHLY